VAENRTDRSGARFIVSIPHAVETGATALHERSSTPATAPSVEASTRTNDEAAEPRALIVDDEPTVRTVLSRILARTGWRLDEARDGAAALELISAAEVATDTYDLILCDLRMPRMSGMALHDALAEQHPSSLNCMIITSGDLASPDVAAFVQRTACRVMEKPLDMAEVLRIAAAARTDPPTTLVA
jgi:CheY-like chemotaxis protein